MRIIDSEFIEIECRCGATNNHLFAEVYGRGRATCRKCGAQTNLKPDENVLLQDYVIAAAEKIRERFRIGEPEE